MKMRQASEQAEMTGSPFGAIRRKISIALVGLMGTGTASGCCFSFSLNASPAERAREAAVNGCENAKHIRIPEARASVLLGRQEKDKEEVEALLYLEPTSPLRSTTGYSVVYELPGSAAPWETLVMEPSGRITLRMKENLIAIKFDCSGSAPNCTGEEIDPAKLATVEPAKEMAPAAQNKPDDKKKTETGETGGMEEPKAPEAPEPEKTETPDRIFVNGQTNYSTTPEIKAQLDALESALEQKTGSEENINWLKVVARKLAENTKWAAEVEDIIREIETDAQAGQFKRKNLVTAIQFLLAQKPETIPVIAKALNVEIQMPVDRTQFLKRVNELRTQSGLQPVGWGECAQQMAELWAKNKEAQAVGDHAAGGSTITKRREQFGCKLPAMENVAVLQQVEANYSFERWRDSNKGHKENMLVPGLTHIGLYCVNGPKVMAPGNFCVMTGTGDQD